MFGKLIISASISVNYLYLLRIVTLHWVMFSGSFTMLSIFKCFLWAVILVLLVMEWHLY